MKKINLMLGLVLAGATGLAAADSLYVDDTGNVGVGTAVPNAPLHVLRATGNAGELIKLENDGGSYITFENNAAASTWWFVNEHTQVMPDGRRFLVTHSSQSGPSFSFSPSGNFIAAGTITSGTTQLDVPDYVFQENYELMPLSDVKKFIEEKSHLPNVPSAKEIAEAGQMDMTQFQMKLLEKVEELTLYTLNQQQEIDSLKAQINNRN